MSEFKIEYHADCKNCGKRAVTKPSSTFVTPFFLPSHCTGCGDYMSGRDYNNPSWEIGHTRYKWVKPKFRITNPRTMFGKWEKVDALV